MIKTLTNLFKQDKEKFVVPKGVQDVIPIAAIYDDGIFQVGRDKFSKTFKFSDINYAVASREDKEAMFLDRLCRVCDKKHPSFPLLSFLMLPFYHNSSTLCRHYLDSVYTN